MFPQNWRGRVNCQRATDYGSRISCFNLTPLFGFFCFYCRLTSGAFTIDNRLFNANFEEKFEWTPDISVLYQTESYVQCWQLNDSTTILNINARLFIFKNFKNITNNYIIVYYATRFINGTLHTSFITTMQT
jgi:hypothetical protein